MASIGTAIVNAGKEGSEEVTEIVKGATGGFDCQQFDFLCEDTCIVDDPDACFNKLITSKGFDKVNSMITLFATEEAYVFLTSVQDAIRGFSLWKTIIKWVKVLKKLEDNNLVFEWISSFFTLWYSKLNIRPGYKGADD